MAEKRMFAKSIIDSDMFLDMPATAQSLYFHLGMRADDDGFINNPKSIMRNVRCTEDDMRILIAKQYIIPFDSGVVVIRHWRIHNYIQKDRYKSTNCNHEKELLQYDEKTKEYNVSEECIQNVNKMDTVCIQNVNKMDTQIRLDKIRLDKSSSSRDIEENSSATTDLIGQEVLDLYQNNIHPLTGIEYEMLMDDVQHYGSEWVSEAIRRAVKRNKRTLGYIEGILKGWDTNGYDDGNSTPEAPRKKIVYADELREANE